MIRIIFFNIAACAILTGLGLANIILLNYLIKTWWEIKLIRRAAWTLLALGVIGFLSFSFGIGFQATWLYYPGAVLTGLVFLLHMTLLISLPISGIILILERFLSRRQTNKPDLPVDISRRRFIQLGASSIPAASALASSYGFGRSFASAVVELKQISFPDLPESLNGLRILHLSDMHLADWITLDSLEIVLTEAERYHPDIVAVTGDIADKLDLLPDAIKLIEGLKPRLGAFATLGNHEYFRGVDRVKAEFDKSTIPLFVNNQQTIIHNSERLKIIGIDDPRRMSGDSTQFFHNCLDATIVGDKVDAFTILLSHRPSVFDYASDRGVNLSLAGHTHGGQMGLFGRSVFESFASESYLWGLYENGPNRLYTSCGMGHWFPFRLGCPPEAPVLELVRA